MTASQELLNLVQDVDNAEILSVSDDGSPVVYGITVEGAEIMGSTAEKTWIVRGRVGIAEFDGIWILLPNGEIEPYDSRITASLSKQRTFVLLLEAALDAEGDFIGLEGVNVYQTPLDGENRKAGLKRRTYWPISHLKVKDVQTTEFWVQLLV